MVAASSSSTSRVARAASNPSPRRRRGPCWAATASPPASCSITCRPWSTPTIRPTPWSSPSAPSPTPPCPATAEPASPRNRRSPDSSSIPPGGRWPATMKRTGFDAIVLTGAAPAPVYVKVGESGAELKPATALWGQTTRDTVHAIQAVEGAESDVLAIGPAGEHLVRFACLATYWKNREGVAGRGGIGAVLGAKRVKAVVVTGGRKTEVADAALLKTLLEEKREPLKTGTKALSTYGTSFLVKPINTLGALGSYNLRQETFAEAQAISGEEMYAHHHDRDTTCLKCPVACGKQYEIRDGELHGLKAKMPEYETIFAFGSMLGNAHAGSLARANDLCDLLGMDTISMGVTLAFACEALERGWLSEREVGVPFGWGDWRGMLKLVEMTATREGFGDRLAEGAWRLAESLHPERSEE